MVRSEAMGGELPRNMKHGKKKKNHVHIRQNRSKRKIKRDATDPGHYLGEG